jgi:hypothetical protein
MIKLNKKYFNKKYIVTLLIFVLIIFLIYYYINSQKYINEHFSKRITKPVDSCSSRFLLNVNSTGGNNSIRFTICSLTYNATKNDVEEKILKQYYLSNNSKEIITDLFTSSNIGFSINIQNNNSNPCNVIVAPYCKADDTNVQPPCNTLFKSISIKEFDKTHRFYSSMIATLMRPTTYTYKMANRTVDAFNCTVIQGYEGKILLKTKAPQANEEESNIVSYTGYTGYTSNTTYTGYTNYS